MHADHAIRRRRALKTLAAVALSGAALAFGGAVLAQDATPAITPFIKAGLKFSYRTVDHIDSACPMVIQTQGFATGEIVTYTVDWTKVTGVSYYPSQGPDTIVLSGEILSKSSQSRNTASMNSGMIFRLDFENKMDPRKLLKAVRDVRDSCGGSKAADVG